MNENFRNTVKRIEEMEAFYKAAFEGFLAKLNRHLIPSVRNYNPRLDNKDTETQLRQLVQKYAREVFENFNGAHWSNNNPGQLSNLPAVEQPEDNRQKAEQRMNKMKQQYPEDYHAQFEAYFWEDYEKDYKSECFKYAVYSEMKAAFTEFYIDDLLEFESEILRNFDRSLYLMCALPFVEEVYRLSSKYRKKEIF